MNRKLNIEALEDRLAPANLALTSAYNCDVSGTALANPVFGQNVYLRVNWNATGMAGTEVSNVRYTVNGVVINSSNISYAAGTNPYSSYRPTGFIGSTAWNVTVTLDPDNLIAETNEADNTASFIVTPVAPTGLPAGKFLTPLGRTANVDWAINNYADVDPTPANNTDYRGGPFTYDGHDAIDAGPWGFFRMDAGFPVYAAADGVVTQGADGYFDRETTGPNTPANYLMINHGNGWDTVYYHLAANTLTVTVGDTVKAGQVIGLMGSSGQSSGQHLHYTVRYNGAQVESGMFPATYWANPLPYGGDVPAFGLDGVYTNYNPSADQNERGSRTTSFGTGEPGTTLLYFGLESYSLKAGENIGWKWYQPNGTLTYSDLYTTPTSARFFLKGSGRFLSDFQGITGTWQVGFEVNGVEFKRLPITINATGEASARVVESGKIIIDERTTPLDFGSVALAGTGPTKTFTVNNHGGAALTLSNLQLPPGFTLSGSFPTTIATGANATFVVQMNSAVVGSKFGRVAFTTNDPDTPEYNFNVKGLVTGSIPAGTPAIALPYPALAYNFKSLPRVFAPGATVTDANSAHFSGGNLKVEVASGGNAFDALAIRNQGTGAGQIGLSGTIVTYAGSPIGTFTGGTAGTPLVITLAAGSTPAVTQALVRNLTYANTNSVPDYPRRYLRLTLTDDTAKVSNLAIAFVTPSGVERAPVIAALANASTSPATPFVRNGSFADSAGNSWTATVNYGDGGATQALALNPDKTFTLTHAYASPGDYLVTATITSDTGGVTTATMTVSVVLPPTVNSLGVNGGGVQRSRITSIAVGFTSPVDVASLGAIAVTRTTPNDAVSVNAGNGLIVSPASGTVSSITLSFANVSNAGLDFGSLKDGRWQVSIPGAGYTSPLNDVSLRRLFGDFDNNGTVDATDFSFFPSFGAASNSPFDFNNNGDIDATDLAQFGNRFGLTL